MVAPRLIMAQPIIVILGQTASGKSALALEMAKKFSGEIIAADSRTIYKDMDIGTAKPTLQEQQQITHHGLNLIDPTTSFSAAEFKEYCSSVVKNIHKKNKIPFIVGGTGLYIDGFVYDFAFGNKADPRLRAELDLLDISQLQARVEALGIEPTDINFMNKRHLTRAIERGGMVQKRAHLPSHVLLVGIKIDKEQLDERIRQRVSTMFDAGLVTEVQNLINHYGEDAPGLLAPGYKAVVEYINDRLTLEEARQLFIRNDRRLAKRQMTWFKRNPDIVWCSDVERAEVIIQNFLTKFKQV